MAGGISRGNLRAIGGFILIAALVGVYVYRGQDSKPTTHGRGEPGDAPADTSPVAVAPIDDREFVGMDACGNCHTQIWRQYRESPMARSLAAPLAAVPQLEYYTNTEFAPPGPRRYHVEREGDIVRHHETLTDTDGTLIYDQAEVVSFALGSGKRGRSYIFESDGMLYKSSISWFSDRKEWGLSPDYPDDSHRRFDRRITEGCVNCHAGRVAVDRGALEKFATPAILETAIGCERCHGAGARHVAAHEEATAGLRLPDEKIVNPARLDTARQISICAQCHLHGEARVLLTGQRACDFQPGQLLEENRIVFVSAGGPSSGSRRQALSQVEQIVQSACYRGSQGKLHCTSCHDPHGNPSPETRVEFYRAKCLACHEQQGCKLPVAERTAQEADDSCMKCHMPTSLELSNILHVSFADHRMPRGGAGREEGKLAEGKSEEGNATDSKEQSDDVVIFNGVDQRLPELEVHRARAFVLVGGTEHSGPTPSGGRRAEQLLLPVVAAHPEDVDALEVLGTACFLQRRVADAERHWQAALKRDPRRETSLHHLAVIKYDQRQMAAARDLLQRYLEVNPRFGTMHAKYAGALGALGDWPASIAAAERAVERNPTLASAHELLAYAYQQAGKPVESERHRRLFEQLRRLVPRAAVEE